MAKTQPTESQIRVVMSDWLGNLRQKDEGNYIHRGTGGIRRRGKRGSVSDYLVEDVAGLDGPDLIKQARMAAEQVANAVVSEPVTVTVGTRDSYHCKEEGTHRIALATDYFDDTSLSKREKVDIMLGLASHEAAHGAYTDESITERHLKKEKAEFRQLKHDIWNLIEDERVEYLLGEDRPGLADMIGATKGYYFKKLLKDTETAGQKPTEPLPRLLSTLAQAVRYPSEMTRDDVEEHFDELDKVRRILTPYPLTPERAWDAANKVMDVIRDMAKDEARKEKQQQDENQSGQGGQPQSPTGNQSEEEDTGQQNRKKASGKKEPSASETDNALRNMLSTAEAKKVLEAIRKDLQKTDPGNETAQFAGGQGALNEQFVNEDDAECISGGPGHPRQFVFKPKGNQQAYLRTLTKVRAYIPAMAKALSCKSQETEYKLHGMPSGRLNTGRLVAFRAGNRNIFDKQGSVTCSSASVVMLIDESGSMNGNREKAAREAAILINEAVARISNVNFFCYGYTNDELTVYSENGKTSRWALSATRSKGGTPTGKAMAMAAERVRRFNKAPALMLVVTDGAPDSARDVIEQDRRLRGLQFSPIGIGVQSNAVSRTFTESIVMEDISGLAVELGKLTKSKLNKMLVRTDSND